MKRLIVCSRLISFRILWCVLRCRYLQEMADCLWPLNAHPNSILRVVLWVFAGDGGLFVAGQYPSEFYIAFCVVGICKK